MKTMTPTLCQRVTQELTGERDPYGYEDWTDEDRMNAALAEEEHRLR